MTDQPRPADVPANDKAFAPEAAHVFPRYIAAFWHDLRDGGMNRAEATEVTIAWMVATIDNNAQNNREDQA
jgi:hypothetical protein